MRARVLHCYADYKWTGPSEPISVLCRELGQRGWKVGLACATAPEGYPHPLSYHARRMGLSVHDEFYFDSRPNLRRNVHDITRLSHLIGDGGFQLLHVHGSWDHMLASQAVRRLARTCPLVRTDHRAREFGRNPFERIQFGPGMTAHLIVLNERLRERTVRGIGVAPENVTAIRGAVDVETYRPRQAPEGMRRQFGLSERDVVFAVTARVQRHRRFDVLLQGFRLLKREHPHVKCIVLGRGTHKEELLDRPVVKMGLEGTVLPLGYRTDDYLDVLAAADAGLMLVPGSDASCRAAMQLAAMEKPLVVARRGVLPDIVADGETGFVVDDTPRKLAEAIARMAANAQMRREFGRAGRRRMVTCFSIERHVSEVEQVYARVLEVKTAAS